MKQLFTCVVGLLLCFSMMNVHADASQSTSKSSSSKYKTVKHSVKVSTDHKSSKRTTAAATESGGKAGSDRLDLDTTTVTGNRELPKVLYIVPWKKADVGNLPGQPFNTLLDEALTPVDREVFRREVDYYHAISNKDQPGKGFAGEQSVSPAKDK